VGAEARLQGSDGIRSNAVAPGMTRTPLIEELYRDQAVLEAPGGGAAAPGGRSAVLTDACAWLGSDRSAYVMGRRSPSTVVSCGAR
jgi:NAD(P)-dependent dehydrogenase (short-subunit alcohol dehydrogenase family)